MPTKFNNFPSPEQAYTGSDSDLQREKRMNNWVRSNSLPSMLGDAVQSAMLNNPYDRSAALRAELAQGTANSMNLPWRTKEALAAELFKASPIDATNGDGAAPGQRILRNNPVAATQSAGPVAARGVVNGREIAVPTAGNYLNGAFQGHLNDLGLRSQSPSWNDYQDAEYNQTTPAQRWQSEQNDKITQRSLDVANINAQGRVNAAAARPTKGGQDSILKEQKKLLGQDDASRRAYTTELYNEFKNYTKRGGTDSFEKWSMTDPVAQVVNDKFQELGAQSGRIQRESRQAQADLMRGNMTPGAQAEQLAQRTIDGPMNDQVHPQQQAKISQGIAEARARGAAAGMSPEQVDAAILQAAKQSGVGGAELAAIQSELDGKILKAQYGKPGVHPASKTKKGSAFTADYQKTLTRGVQLQPSAPAPPVPHYSMDDPTNDRRYGTVSRGPAPSILDELIRRIQAGPSIRQQYPESWGGGFQPFNPVRRYAASSPIT